MAAEVKVNDKVWREMKERLLGLDRAQVKVGVIDGKGAEQEERSSGLTIGEIANLHEFGDEKSGLPERSWLRKTISDQKDKIAKFSGALYAKVMTDKLSKVRALELLGAFVAGECKKTITAGRVGGPALRPSTIAAKGSSKKLLDRGQLLGAITFEVVA